MLNKKVCRACVTEMAGKPVLGFPHDGAAATWHKWDDGDDRRWKNGKVLCRNWPTEFPQKRKDKPPKWCRYVLEHTVSEKR